MKIRFLQSGGTAPWVQYQPVTVNTASSGSSEESTSSTKKSSSENKLTDKDLLSLLEKIDGLPSDMQKLYDDLTFYMRIGSLDGLDTSSLATQFIRSTKAVKDAKYRKEAFDKAYDQIKGNGGLHEYAITDTGKIVCQGRDGKLQTLSPSEIRDSEFSPLTNAQLLRIRAESPTFAGADWIMDVVSNGIGMEEVNKLIHNYMISLGTSENTEGGFMRNPYKQSLESLRNLVAQIQDSDAPQKEKEQQIAALQGQILSEVSGAEEAGLYQYTKTTKSQLNQAKAALSYIYTMLPANAKTLLQTKVGSEDNAKALIFQLLVSGTSSTNSIKWDLIEKADGTKPGSKESADADKRNNDPVTGFIAGLGYEKEGNINIGTSQSFKVNGRYSTLVDKSGSLLPANSTFLDVIGSAFGPVLETNQATMGGERLDGDRTKVLITNADIIRVDLPYDKKYYQETGYYRPDLALTKKIEDAEFDVKNAKLTDPEAINRVYTEDHQLPPKYVKDNNGGWKQNTHDWYSFAMIDAVAEETAFSNSDNLTLLTEITDDNKKREIRQVFKKNDEDYSPSEGNWIWNNNLYHGQIFIPIRESYIGASYGSGQYTKLNGNDALDIQEKEALLHNYSSAPSLSTLK